MEAPPRRGLSAAGRSVPPKPLIDFALGFFLGLAVALLNLAGVLLAIALNRIEVVVGELGSLGLHLALELLPVSFHLVPVHFELHVHRAQRGCYPVVSSSLARKRAALCPGSSRDLHLPSGAGLAL